MNNRKKVFSMLDEILAMQPSESNQAFRNNFEAFYNGLEEFIKDLGVERQLSITLAALNMCVKSQRILIRETLNFAKNDTRIISRNRQ